ncbi:MAG TPA: hypothetical protein DD417_19570 [Elusimicrobia bacterium]|nr:hypothetical protein [Elusimicrobiota bacterium]
MPIEDFSDPAKRAAWIREKGLKVFSLHSPLHPATEIDLFSEAPLDFERALAAAMRRDLAPGVEAVFVDLESLLKLKRRAGRPVDLLDIERLEALRRSADG